jgi:hypothetical protein
MTNRLVLDSSIRDWVLFPIVLVVFLFGILRHYVVIMMRSTRKMDKEKLRQAQTLRRAQILRTNANYIPKASFENRKRFFTDPERGLLHKNIPSNTLSAMADPNNMMEMMKGNIASIVPNMLMLGWVSYFFAGFVIAKFPFPLTPSFREMVQRGIELSSLDVSYVTSASMYFLILFGLRGIYSLVLGENAVDDAQLMQQQMSAGMMPGAPGVDMGAMFKEEAENLELVKQEDALKNVERDLIARIQKSKEKNN